MKMIPALSLVAILSAATPLAATGLSVSPSALERDAASASTTLSVSWKNAWRNERNHDAVWLFVRVAGKDGRSRPVRVAKSGHTATGSLEIRTPEDRAGVFVFPSAAHRGDVTTKVRLELDPSSLPSVPAGETLTPTVFGIEMVSIPAGPFFVGDLDPVALDYGGFFRAGQNGEPDGLYEVKSEAPIQVGPFAGGLD